MSAVSVSLLIAEVLGTSTEPDLPFMAQGVDSILAVELSRLLAK